MPRLVFLSDDVSSIGRQSFEVTRAVSRIGSNSENDLVIAHESIACQHAVITCDGVGFFIEAVGGSELFVNEEPMTRCRLSHGDVVRVGALCWQFELFAMEETARHGTSPTRDELLAYGKLYEFSQKLLADYQLPNILENLVDAILDITGADRGLLFVLNEGRTEVKVARTWEHEPFEDAEAHYSASVVERVISSREPLLVNDAINDPELGKAKSVWDLSLRSVMCVPMFTHGALTGLLYVCNRTFAGLFTAQHLEVLTIFAQQASLLIENAVTMEALRESELRHRSLVELSPETIAVLARSEFVFINSAGEKLLRGDSEEPLVGVHMTEFLAEGGRGRLELLEALKGKADFGPMEVNFVGRDGKRITAEIAGTPIMYDGQAAMQVVIHDITNQKALLAERLRMDRLVAMGTLAAGVGHEINNPLSYVHANLDFAVGELARVCQGIVEEPAQGADPLVERLVEVRAGLQAACEGAGRIRDVVQGVQAFSRPGSDLQVNVDVERPLKFSINIAQNEVRYRAQLIREFSAPPMVRGTESRLGQVFLNLLINAAHAIPQGAPETNFITVRTYEENGFTIVEVEDTGIGIAEEQRERIFEPFITTKGDGQGTGLGLPICRDIVQELGGTIEVESEVGVGSCFRVRLPYATDRRADPRGRGVIKPTRSGRLLVIDDEVHIGRALRRALSGEHDVVVVSSGQDGLDLLESDDGFDGVFCDLMMPGLTGIDVFRELQRRESAYLDRLVFTTAGVFTRDEQRFLSESPVAWLAKPFDMQQLREQVALWLVDQKHG